MRLAFTKMQGLGNDFVVIDAVSRPVVLTAAQLRRLADRHLGVGCDQVLLVEPAPGPGIDFGYRIFNADGGEVGQCGNGARCLARFLRESGLSDRDRVRVGTASRVMELRIEADGQVSVDMGEPVFDPARIPLAVDAEAERYALEVDGETLSFGAVSMGNPHMLIEVADAGAAPVARLGPRLESHPLFPERVNVGFAQRLAPDRLRLRVYERGVGETRACGSGACAAVAVGRRQGWLDERVTVALTGGELVIHWHGPGTSLWMTGPAATVFQGRIDL